MERIWYFKLAIVIAIILVSAVCLVGSVADRYDIPFFKDHVNTELQLGLDLSGGVRLVYKVLIDDALRHRRQQTAQGLRNVVRDDLHVENVAYRPTGKTGFYLLFLSERDASKVNHSFIREHGWATDLGDSEAAEAHFEVDDNASRPARAIARTVKQRVSQRLGLDDIRLEQLPERRFALLFSNRADLERLNDDVVDNLTDVSLVGRYTHKIQLDLKDEVRDDIVNRAVEQAKKVINNRIDEMGIANTSVSQSGTNVIIEIPAGSTAEAEGGTSAFVDRTKRIIERTARLEFKIADDTPASNRIYQKLRPLAAEDERVELVDEDRSYFLRASDTKIGDKVVSGKNILQSFLERAQEKGLEVPEDREFRFEEIPQRKSRGDAPVDRVWRTYYLISEAEVSGEHIGDARVAYEQQGPEAGMPYVALTFNEQGREAFGRVTKQNVGKRMAIVLDNEVNSAPVIQEAILGGHARITMGSFGDANKLLEESRDLVVVLRAGGLPAPITLVNEEEVGPELGADSIRRGGIAILAGAVIVVIFMIIYYRVSGVISDIALIINLGMIFAILGLLGATLTLPGLAGIVLTVGMAVDANVIIFERIREELRAGKSPRAAVDAGYGRAFWTIFDAQFTTLIAGVVLLDQGTGPIKGFAVTLLIGIVTSMVSAIFITRVAFDWITKRKRLERLSI